MEDKMPKKSIRFSLFVSLLLFVIPCFGQSSSGSISGTVTDEAQAVVAGANVMIRNIDVGLTRSAVTGSDGRFNFVDIPIGSYEVTVTAANFA